MFKNATLYRIAPDWVAGFDQVEQALSTQVFVECGASQEKSTGWVPPRGEQHGALLEVIGGQWIARLMIETRTVPGDAITRETDAQIKVLEQTRGRKPGKRETREIKSDVRLALLPHAFSRQAAVWVWIDPQARLLVIDTASQSIADQLVTELVKVIDGLAVALIDTKVSPMAAMTTWLVTQEPPSGFSVDRECELKAADESKAVVRYSRSPLDTDDVREQVESGKLPTQLALTWNSRLSFVLTDKLTIKKVQFLDVVFEQGTQLGEDSGFDCDVSIATSEMGKMIADLVCALGGKV